MAIGKAGLMNADQILNLAAKVAPLVRSYGVQHGQLTPDVIRKALKQIGSGASSDRTVQLIDNYICEFFV